MSATMTHETATLPGCGCPPGTVARTPVPLVPSPAGNEPTASLPPSRLAHLNLLWQVIADLREITDVERLVDAAPAAVCRLGFDRAMISRVEHSTWLVQRFHSAKDPDFARTVTDLAREHPPTLGRNLFEADVVRRRRPVLVVDAQNDPRVNPELAEATMSTSYVVAPIMPDGEVIGLIHADRSDGGPAVDLFDREIIALFASQFGQVLERAVLIARLDTLKSRMDDMTRGLSGLVSGCIDGFTDMTTGTVAGDDEEGTARQAIVRHVPTHDPDDLLTKREIDVLRLMAAGDTNSRIASRLVISEGTVKSHVRHILRKLNAANRAEAVCRWFQSEAARP